MFTYQRLLASRQRQWGESQTHTDCDKEIGTWKARNILIWFVWGRFHEMSGQNSRKEPMFSLCKLSSHTLISHATVQVSLACALCLSSSELLHWRLEKNKNLRGLKDTSRVELYTPGISSCFSALLGYRVKCFVDFVVCNGGSCARNTRARQWNITTASSLCTHNNKKTAKLFFLIFFVESQRTHRSRKIL